MGKQNRRINQFLVLTSIFCLILLIAPELELGAAQSSPIKITELTCDKKVLAPGENATVRIAIKNIGPESLHVFGELSPNPNASYEIDVLVGSGHLNAGYPDYLYYLEYYITNTGEYSRDTDVAIKASIFGSHIEGTYSMNATEADAVPELASESFTVTFLKNDALPLDSTSNAASEPYPLWILIVVVAVIVVCIFSLYAYRRRKKQNAKADKSGKITPTVSS
jgi:hypothetical protein